MKKKFSTLAFCILFFYYGNAQIEAYIKFGSSKCSINRIDTESYRNTFHFQAGGGYRFFTDKRISIIPSLFIDKSGFQQNNLVFGNVISSNSGLMVETTSITLNHISFGIKSSFELKLLNLEKKTNFYLSPNIGFRKIVSSTQKASPDIEGLNKHPSYGNYNLFDYGFSAGVKFSRLKVDLFYRNVLDLESLQLSAFVVTNAMGVGVHYMFNHSNTTK